MKRCFKNSISLLSVLHQLFINQKTHGIKIHNALFKHIWASIGHNRLSFIFDIHYLSSLNQHALSYVICSTLSIDILVVSTSVFPCLLLLLLPLAGAIRFFLILHSQIIIFSAVLLKYSSIILFVILPTL